MLKKVFFTLFFMQPLYAGDAVFPKYLTFEQTKNLLAGDVCDLDGQSYQAVFGKDVYTKKEGEELLKRMRSGWGENTFAKDEGLRWVVNGKTRVLYVIDKFKAFLAVECVEIPEIFEDAIEGEAE